jgi:hypothetical protein
MGAGLLVVIAAAAVGLVDDLVFAGIDVTQGYKSPGEVGVELGKKTAIAAASVAASAAFSGVGKIVEKTTDAAGKVTQVAESGVILKSMSGSLGDSMGQVALNAGLAGAKTLTTSTISSAVNAAQWDGSGLTWNRDVFDDGFKSGLVSSAVSMAGTFTSGALGQINMKDGNSIWLNGHTFDTNSIQKLNSLTGNLVGAGLNYAMTGEATLNVLNLSDLTGGKLNSGLLELHLGGENGVSMNIGTGGTDISLGTIAGAMSGLSDSTKVIMANVYNLIWDKTGVYT